MAPDSGRTRINSYLGSAVLLAAALLLRWLLDPILGGSLPLVTLFGAVAGASWLGGYRPAIAVAIVGYLVDSYLFIEPRGQLFFANPAILVGFAAYLLTCSLIIVFGEAVRRAERQALGRQELLRVTFNSIGDAVITTDLDGRITYLNPVAESLTGWPLREAAGQPLETVFRIINETSRQPVASPAKRALEQGTVVGLANHTVLIRRDGSELTIDDSAAPIRDEESRVSGCVLIFRDVSDRRALETAAAERFVEADQLAAIVHDSDDAIIRKSLDGIIQSWNSGAERIFGHTAEEALGRPISLIIPPERMAEEEAIIAALQEGRRVDHAETERIRRDGRRILVSLTVSPIRSEDGAIIGASTIARDVTRQRRAEADRQRFATVAESSTDFIGMCDLDGIPFYINRAGQEMVGLDGIEKARVTHLRDFFFPEDQPLIEKEFLPRVLADGHGEIDVRFRHFKTGAARWMAYKVVTLADDGGRPIGFATVSQDITERRRLEDTLRKLAADLSEVDRRKDEFLATLAHELRNPLAPLSNALEILKRADGVPATVRQVHQTMERQLAQLIRLVDDLLDLNRITHNRLELRRSTVELASVIHQAVEASRPLSEAAGHTVEVTVPPAPIYLDADPARLAQVIGNLINNSCRYTNPGGRIWVTARRDDGQAEIRVRDTGIGIPADKLGTIFEMFSQIDRSLERTRGGLGIGLTLVQQLVRMHGGTVEVTSPGEGAGSEFVVRLPALASPPVALPAETGRTEPVATRRILVVDDNNDSAASLAMLLELTGHQTFLAHDGPEAFEAAREHRPDVVLLDIGLPRLSGYDVCRMIRSEPWGKDMLLLAVTGWGQDGDRRKSREAGFDGHLVKPVEYSALMTLLEELAPPAADPALGPQRKR